MESSLYTESICLKLVWRDFKLSGFFFGSDALSSLQVRLIQTLIYWTRIPVRENLLKCKVYTLRIKAVGCDCLLTQPSLIQIKTRFFVNQTWCVHEGDCNYLQHGCFCTIQWETPVKMASILFSQWSNSWNFINKLRNFRWLLLDRLPWLCTHSSLAVSFIFTRFFLGKYVSRHPSIYPSSQFILYLVFLFLVCWKVNRWDWWNFSISFLIYLRDFYWIDERFSWEEMESNGCAVLSMYTWFTFPRPWCLIDCKKRVINKKIMPIIHVMLAKTENYPFSWIWIYPSYLFLNSQTYTVTPEGKMVEDYTNQYTSSCHCDSNTTAVLS